MPKQVSHGVLIVNERGELLLAHATGQRQWDIPKGGAEPGEVPVIAAVREAFEETGIALQPESLRDLGVFSYMPAKDLHLFLARGDSRAIDLGQCQCTSLFKDRYGKERPEVDAFRWVDPGQVARLCTPRMAGVLARALPMAGI